MTLRCSLCRRNDAKPSFGTTLYLWCARCIRDPEWFLYREFHPNKDSDPEWYRRNHEARWPERGTA